MKNFFSFVLKKIRTSGDLFTLVVARHTCVRAICCRGCAILLCLPLLLSGCKSTGPNEPVSHSFFAMDTVINVTLPPNTPDTILKLLEETVSKDEQRLSATISTSEIAAFNQSADGITLSKQTSALIKEALQVSDATNGAFCITIAPLSFLYKPFLRGETDTPPDQEAIAKAQRWVNDEALTLTELTLTKTDPAVQIELGACAKGDACAHAVEILKENGISWGMLSFGGNIGVFGEKPDGSAWRIGIQNPKNTDALIGSVTLEDEEFVSVSGNYQRTRTYEDITYHHIIDPKTGMPAEKGLDSVAVITNNGALADALSTALFVLGYEDGMTLYQSSAFSFEAVFCKSNGEVLYTPGLKDRFIPTA